jgi:preprotein translocase subunit Sec63
VGELTAAFVARLKADATLTALIAKYPVGSGDPAVFSVDPVPEDAVLPYVVTVGEVTQVPEDTKTTRRRRVVRDVRVYADANGGADLIEDAQERIHDLFHRFLLVVTGYATVIAEVAGMGVIDEKDVYGRVVTVRLTLEEV